MLHRVPLSSNIVYADGSLDCTSTCNYVQTYIQYRYKQRQVTHSYRGGINEPLYMFCAQIIAHLLEIQYHIATIFRRLEAPIHTVCPGIYRLPTSVTNATITAATTTNIGSLSITDTDVARTHPRDAAKWLNCNIG